MHFSREPDYDLDRLLEQLASSKLPEILPVDALAAVHHPLSEKYGAISVRAAETPGEEYRIAELLSGFRELIRKLYAEQLDSLGVAFVQRGAAMEVLSDGSIVPSVVVEMRSANGSSVLGNNERLYETHGGPALVWIRESPKRDNFELRAIYSPEAFESELSTLARRASELIGKTAERPLVLDYAVQTIERSLMPLTGMIFDITGARVDPARPENVVELSTSNGMLIDCHIERDPRTFDLTFRFVFKHP